MTLQIPVRIDETTVAEVDRLVAEGRFASRSDALRTALDRLIADEREQAIEDAYRRAHERTPQAETEEGLPASDVWARSEGGERPRTGARSIG